MSRHELWHVFLLALTLFAAAGLAALALLWLGFDEPVGRIVGVKPLVWALLAVAALLLVVEWVGVH